MKPRVPCRRPALLNILCNNPSVAAEQVLCSPESNTHSNSRSQWEASHAPFVPRPVQLPTVHSNPPRDSPKHTHNTPDTPVRPEADALTAEQQCFQGKPVLLGVDASSQQDGACAPVVQGRLARMSGIAGHSSATEQPSRGSKSLRDAPRQCLRPCMRDKPGRRLGKEHSRCTGHEHGPRKRQRAAAPQQKVSACMHWLQQFCTAPTHEAKHSMYSRCLSWERGRATCRGSQQLG